MLLRISVQYDFVKTFIMVSEQSQLVISVKETKVCKVATLSMSNFEQFRPQFDTEW